MTRAKMRWHHAAMALVAREKLEAAIVVNSKTWPLSSRVFKYRALIHEACHVVSIFMVQHLSEMEREAWLGADGHGPLWRDLMQMLGCPADYRHDKGLYWRPHRADCRSCGAVHPVTHKQARTPLLLLFLPQRAAVAARSPPTYRENPVVQIPLTLSGVLL